MLDTRLVSLNDDASCGRISGFYPLHAVAANGIRNMYDFLVHDLPADLAADKWRLTKGREARLVALNMDGMTPVQLTAKRGMRFMFQHIMKAELTRILWVWGPVTQYQLVLDGIDSAGHGASDVMEVLIRSDASVVTKQLILDDFMGGFLFQLYQQKWVKFGWYMHLAMRALDFALVAAVAVVCVQLKSEGENKESHVECLVLLSIIIAFVAVEGALGVLYANNIKGNLPTLEVLRRTWEWMNSFAGSLNLVACGFMFAAVVLYFVDESFHPEFGLLTSIIESAFATFAEGVSDDGAEGVGRNAGQDIVGRLLNPNVGDVGAGLPDADGRQLEEGSALIYTAATMAQKTEAIIQNNIDTAVAASWSGIEPLIWLLLGTGFLIKFYTLIDQFVQPYMSLSVFVLAVKQVLRGELMVFMCIFLMFICAFIFTMVTIYPDHPSAGPLPQAPELMHWFTAANAILLSGFTGEPLDINLHPDYIAPLGPFQKLNLSVFYSVYIVYIFLSLILLLNLLIALLGSTFSKTQAESSLQGRLAFARIVLRLELVADALHINTRAGEQDGDKFVHNFRDTVPDEYGELTRDHKSEYVFDLVPTTKADDATEEKPVAAVATPAATPSAVAASTLDSEKIDKLEATIGALVGQLATLTDKVAAISTVPSPRLGGDVSA